MLCPVFRGGIRVAQSQFCRKLTARDEFVLTRLCGGPQILVNLNDYDGRSLYFWGANDRKITWLVGRLLSPGDTMLDIGANFGPVGLAAARRVGPDGSVHCFEPQPQLADCIRQSASINGLHNLVVHELALSNRDGMAILTVPAGHSGRGSICGDVRDGNAVSVAVRHAGPYLQSLALRNVRVIKIDVEAHEDAVLGGAADFLKEAKPLAIIFESHDTGQPFFNRAPITILQSLGYEFFQIRQRPLFRVQLRKLSNPQDVEAGYDFVACEKARAELPSVCSVV